MLRAIAQFAVHVSRGGYAAGGASVVNHGEVDRETFLHPHLEAAKSNAQYFAWTLSNLIALLRWNLFSYRDLWNWINRPFDTPPESPPEHVNWQPGRPHLVAGLFLPE